MSNGLSQETMLNKIVDDYISKNLPNEEGGASIDSTDWENAHFAIDSLLKKRGNPFLRFATEDSYWGKDRASYQFDKINFGETAIDTFLSIISHSTFLHHS